MNGYGKWYWFDGRIPRTTYWVSLLVLFCAALVIVGLSTLTIPGQLLFIGFVAVYYLVVVVHIKRWHDRNKPAWWMLLVFIPIIGGIWTLVELGFLAGTDGPNRYGDDPTIRRPVGPPERGKPPEDDSAVVIGSEVIEAMEGVVRMPDGSLRPGKTREGLDTIDMHIDLSRKSVLYYRERATPDGLDRAIAACEEMIDLAPQAAVAFRYELERELPAHAGYRQLAIIREEQKDYAAALALSKQALEQGWAGDWGQRIDRLERRLAGLG